MKKKKSKIKSSTDILDSFNYSIKPKKSDSQKIHRWMQVINNSHASEDYKKKRFQISSCALMGMLSSAAMCDRTKINKTKWSKVAVEWADALLNELGYKKNSDQKSERTAGKTA